VGLLVHQYHLVSENKAQQEEIWHLRATTVQFQVENQQLQKEKQQLREEKQYLREENQRLREEKQQLREEKQHLREENQQLQKEKQQLREENQYPVRDDGSSTLNKVLFCVTTAYGVTSVVAGVAGGVVVPTNLHQAATYLLYNLFGIDLSTSIPKIEGPS
jgi:ATP-dependent Clp protease ATP-binding subunit ClpA